MLSALLLCLLMVSDGQARPTLVVLPLTTEGGASASTANLISDHVVDALRKSASFARVSTQSDLEAVLGLERMRELMDCTQESCTAEVAGALGAELILRGSVGKLGESQFLNLKLIEVRSARVLASTAQRVLSQREDALFDVVAPAVERLLVDAGLSVPAPAAPPVEPAIVTTPSPPVERGGPDPIWLAIAGVATGAALFLVPLALVGFGGLYTAVGVSVWKLSNNTVYGDVAGVAAGSAMALVLAVSALAAGAFAVFAAIRGVRGS